MRDGMMEYPPRKILLVDDEQNVLNGMRRVMWPLRQIWALQYASCAEQALDLMASAHFDLIIADIQMPGRNGIYLLERALADYPRTTRFALSGFSDREMVLQAAGVAHQFFAKPCDARRLRAAMQQVFRYRDIVARAPEMLELVSRTQSLPVLGETHDALADLFSQAGGDWLGGLHDVVRGDLALAAKVMHLARWALFDPRGRMRDLERALSCLGTDFLRNLFCATPLFLKADEDIVMRMDARTLFAHGVTCGALAERIVRTLTPHPRLAADAAVAGLLLNVGQWLLITARPREFEVVLEEHRESGIPLHELEQKMFGLHHGMLGAALMAFWGLPRMVTETLAFHHNPGDAVRPMRFVSVAVHAADAILRDLECTEEVSLLFRAICRDDPFLQTRLPQWCAMARQVKEANYERPVNSAC